jgi:hypothetical protein
VSDLGGPVRLFQPYLDDLAFNRRRLQEKSHKNRLGLFGGSRPLKTLFKDAKSAIVYLCHLKFCPQRNCGFRPLMNAPPLLRQRTNCGGKFKRLIRSRSADIRGNSTCGLWRPQPRLCIHRWDMIRLLLIQKGTHGIPYVHRRIEWSASDSILREHTLGFSIYH